MKILKALFGSLGFLAVLLAVYFVHISFFTVDVIFYAAIFDGLVATALAGVILHAWRAFAIFEPFEKAQMIFIWFLGAYIFAISIPTVVDRSLSFYILEKLQQRGGAIRKSRMEDVFTQEYVKEYRLVDVRLTEQLQSGTIRIEGDCVKLTTRGETLANFSRFFHQHLLPKRRLLMGEYTDDLTDPFRHSPASPDYSCR